MITPAESDFQGTIVVTGANGGLGSAFVEQFLHSSLPYHGVFTVRERSASSSGTLERLLSETKGSHAHRIAQLDLCSLASVRAFAENINSLVSTRKIPKIRALVLNAARQSFKGIRLTTDGFEATFAVNYLSNFLLVLLLLHSMDAEEGRIILISSFTHDPQFYMNSSWAERSKSLFTDFELAAKPPAPGYHTNEFVAGMRRYALSKLLIIMFMYLLPLVCFLIQV
jgi:NAD(P)-dependent dehydrogenase (short-subunit alcohol dehydrogenase family)